MMPAIIDGVTDLDCEIVVRFEAPALDGPVECTAVLKPVVRGKLETLNPEPGEVVSGGKLNASVIETVKLQSDRRSRNVHGD